MLDWPYCTVCLFVDLWNGHTKIKLLFVFSNAIRKTGRSIFLKMLKGSFKTVFFTRNVGYFRRIFLLKEFELSGVGNVEVGASAVKSSNGIWKYTTGVVVLKIERIVETGHNPEAAEERDHDALPTWLPLRTVRADTLCTLDRHSPWVLFTCCCPQSCSCCCFCLLYHT